MVVGLVRPDAGSIRIDGIDATAWPMYRRCQQGLGYLAQEPTIFAAATVERNRFSHRSPLSAASAAVREAC